MIKNLNNQLIEGVLWPHRNYTNLSWGDSRPYAVLQRTLDKDRNYTNLSRGDSRPYAVLQRTLDEDCRQAEELKQLADEASWSTWGSSANTLQSSALALCYSAAEYCAPVWSRSAHTSQVDVQLTGTLRSTPLPSLPVLFNIEPPAIRRKAATDKLVGQSSLISLAHHCYDWHPGSHCGWSCNQLTSKSMEA